MNDALHWMLVGHVFGDMVWIAGLLAAIVVLRAGASADASSLKPIAGAGRSAGMIMDLGATLSILFGVLLLVVPIGGTAIFKQGGFFHAKLTLVVVLLGVHVYLRMGLGRLKRGRAKAPPGILLPVAGIVVLGIVAMIIAHPF